eukprot:CAMPEP_0177464702 /NCGR_PEP_ID=MMETSP0369-20130122/17015_1 /TAXON_ID=447022 ORGANISM="Scrippsiella hangoei-like, Strain SHHI-4" /NCGR_SAMPLE_ID=MMETSP0369 /ASSEMBLY_ACC=CAM_ASM_000364 /LENGTH=86 /DNA_ID=CAMNT_0018938525 /DNA_START=1 /DNA_END=258 /DNA_ORIENTATION=+
MGSLPEQTNTHESAAKMTSDSSSERRGAQTGFLASLEIGAKHGCIQNEKTVDALASSSVVAATAAAATAAAGEASQIDEKKKFCAQ